MKLSKYLAASASVLILAGAHSTAQEQADESGRESAVDRVLNTVTVTATKKQNVENVQDVAVAVTAYNSDTLDALNVTTLESLSYSSPNVSLDDVGTAKGTANFAIRGLGVNSSIPSIDPAVGVFIDGVYLGVNNGVVVDLFDLDSVEVLRGPQGLLFGRNTTGGALVVNTANPTDEFSYKLRADVNGPVDSDRGGLNSTVQGIVSGPLIADVLNGKIGISYNTDEGYFKNLANGEKHGELQATTYRGALEFFPTERLTFLAKAEYTDSYGDGPTGQNRGIYERDTFDFAINNSGFGESTTTQASLRADYDVDFGNGTITNIVGYRDYDSMSAGDIDSTPLVLFESGAEFVQEQLSNELRYAGTFGDLDLTTGLFYFEQELGYTESRTIPSDPRGTYYGGGTMDHETWGVFANVDYSFTEKLIGTAGLRYSNEEKSADVVYIQPRAECSMVAATCDVSGTNQLFNAIYPVGHPLYDQPNGFSDSNDWSNWTPKVGLQYFWSDNVQTYATYTKGFRSGGYNFRITNVAIFDQVVAQTGDLGFDEEEIDAYEIGLKSQSEDGRIQLNGSVFLTDISNMQREINTSDPVAGVAQNIVNSADATIWGLETEARIAVLDNTLITFNAGLIDASYDDVLFDLSGDGIVDANDLALDLPRVPPLTFGFGIIQDIDLGNSGALVATANFQHRDRIAYTDSNLGWVQEADMLTADLTWETPFNGLAVSLYGKNLLDEVQAGNDTQLPFGGNVAALAPGGTNLATGQSIPYGAHPTAGTFSPLKKGRLVGLELTYKY